ncbi:MAG: PCRF domain-containing protein, partial [Prevotellaceae bacterium]|nr:PCRF domain-containing protein [Prevotellaceae bacterium]
MSENKLLDKLKGIKIRFEEVEQQITDPEVIADIKRFITLNREYRELEPVVEAATKYENISGNIESAKEMLEVEK